MRASSAVVVSSMAANWSTEALAPAYGVVSVLVSMSPLSCIGASWGCQRQAGDAHERQPWAMGGCGLRGIAIPIVPAWEGGPLRRLGFACREEIDDALVRMRLCMLGHHGGEDFGFVPGRVT